MESHLLQMRGLKPSPGGIAKNLLVASFTDAWIETLSLIWYISPRLSHLLQMRGLKQTKHGPAHFPPCRIFYRCVD